MQKKKYSFLNLLNIFVTLFKRIFQQKSNADEGNILLFWRKRIFNTIFLCTVLTGAFTYISNVQIAVQTRQWLNAIVYTLAYFSLIVMVIMQAIPFKVRAGRFINFLWCRHNILAGAWPCRQWPHVSICLCHIGKFAIGLKGWNYCIGPKH